MLSLQRCLNPRSIAVVGGREASRVIEQCRKFGFDGTLYAINPQRETLAGLDCYATVADLPSVPDVAFVAVPAEPSIAIIGELARMGAGGAICYASGFNETGERDRHRRLLEAAAEMPVIGPNCYGYLNAMSGAALWPDQHGLDRIAFDPERTGGDCVAIFSSSGNVSINLTMQQRSLPIGLLVTVGNQAMVGIEQCMEAVLDDPRIAAIGLHIEGLNALPLFATLTQRATEAGKPIVVLKTGRSEIGARITMSHTATMAGQEALYDSLFERLGVAVVHDLETFVETLKLASVTGPLKGGRIASMSCSGGEASLIADLANRTCLTFPSLRKEHAEQVRSTLNEFVSIDNPLDYHTFIWGDRQRLYDTFRAMLLGNFDLTLLILDYPYVNDCDMAEWVEAGIAFADACVDTGRPGAVVSSMVENFPESARPALLARGVVPLQGLRSAVDAIAALATAGINRREPPTLKALEIPTMRHQLQSLSEYDAKQMFAEYAIQIPEGVCVKDGENGLEAASRIGYPLVLKANGATLLHKTEVDGVAVGIDNDDDFRTESHRLSALGESLLVEEMISKPVAELLIGISTDPQFGHFLVIGSGGVLAEMLADRQVLLLPATNQQIKDAIGRLGCIGLLDGYRGAAGADLNAVVDAARKLVTLAEDQGDRLIEAEINPLMVGAPGSGAIAADALVVLRASSGGKSNQRDQVTND